MRLIFYILPLALMGCTQFPELDGVISRESVDADYPKLLPMHDLTALSATPTVSSEQAASTLNARAASLQSRAARLRNTVVDENTRQRMQDGVN